MHFETRAIHVGQQPEEATGAVMAPIYATSTFAQIRPGETRGYDYTRSGNPNFTRLGETLASLDGTRTGGYPKGNVSFSEDGATMFGTTIAGGANDPDCTKALGTVFSLPTPRDTATPSGRPR